MAEVKRYRAAIEVSVGRHVVKSEFADVVLADDYTTIEREVERLRKENEELRWDAAAYRVLRDGDPSVAYESGKLAWTVRIEREHGIPVVRPCGGPALDACIATYLAEACGRKG